MIDSSKDEINIIIATAEPLGAYHLQPLYKAMKESSAFFYHLIPYPEEMQGIPWENTVYNQEVLERADLLVITGGGWSAWTESLAYRATSLGKPFIISELAYSAQPDEMKHPIPQGVSAVSPASSISLARYYRFPQNEIVVTGSPLLDGNISWVPEGGRILILSSANSCERDPNQELLKLARNLKAEGRDVLVRLHPREPKGLWSEFPLDSSSSAITAACTSSLVIGYPGTAHPLIASLSIPVVAVSPDSGQIEYFPEEYRRVIPNWITEAKEFDILSLQDSDPSVADWVVGPKGDSATRMVTFWLEKATQLAEK